MANKNTEPKENKNRADVYLSNHIADGEKENFKYLDDLPAKEPHAENYDGHSVYSLEGFAERESELGGTGDEDVRYEHEGSKSKFDQRPIARDSSKESTPK